MGAYACFCEVDKEMAPISKWCAPCREAASVRWVVIRLSTKLPVLSADGGLMLFRSRRDAVEWVVATIGIDEAIGRYVIKELSEI